MEQRFKPWNDEVWGHQWQIAKSQCLLCSLQGTGILAGSQFLCSECLNEFPTVPWHPTGSVRPGMRALLTHIENCLSPSIHQIAKDSESC